MRRRLVTTGWCGAAAVTLLAVAQLVALARHDDGVPSPYRGGIAGVPGYLEQRAPEPVRHTAAYEGYGTWVDVYDYVPELAGGRPNLVPEQLGEMAEAGVRTLYLQAAHDNISTLLVNEELLGRMLVQAQQAGMQVVGWYLPTFNDVDRDLDHLRAIADFEVLKHRFDGVAVDIEWTRGVPDHAQRSQRLVELSRRLRRQLGDDALGAIVLPPVQIEVVNPRMWPEFPWKELEPYYDVWLPMAYWTQRTPESGYQDGHRYIAENVELIRERVGDDEAEVHPIGGLADALTLPQAVDFITAVRDTESTGASIYDWTTLHRPLSDHLATELNDD